MIPWYLKSGVASLLPKWLFSSCVRWQCSLFLGGSTRVSRIGYRTGVTTYEGSGSPGHSLLPLFLPLLLKSLSQTEYSEILPSGVHFPKIWREWAGPWLHLAGRPHVQFSHRVWSQEEEQASRLYHSKECSLFSVKSLSNYKAQHQEFAPFWVSSSF